MLTTVLASKLLRQIFVDYNYWPESDLDTSLKLFRSRTAFTEQVALSRDASMRRAAMKVTNPEVTGYKAPERRVEVKTFHEVIWPLINRKIGDINDAHRQILEGVTQYYHLSNAVQATEYFTQLNEVFIQLNNPQVTYVRDGSEFDSDLYTGFFITGEGADGGTLIAQALLRQEV